MRYVRMILVTIVVGAGAIRAQDPCKDNAACPPDHYCAKAPGDCQGLGQCAKRPDVCPAVWDPVCGCDGRTYGNACEAAAAGVNVAYTGPCIPETCDGNGDCPEGWYCAKAEGDCDGEGECQQKPVACPEIWDPVCGCDGQTYSNACFAAAAGVNVAYTGPCIPETCDGNGDCPEGWYCAKAEGDCNGQGECRERPQICPDVWAPVCGCDDRTYGNACEAAAAGVNVAYRGPCLPPGPTIVMAEPRVMPDDVHTGPSGVPQMRLLWSEPVLFAAGDVNTIDESGAPVPCSVDGVGTAIMTIRFDAPVRHDRYVVTIRETVIGADSGLAIDGDNDGRTGGDAIVVLEHRHRADLDNDNRIDLTDLARLAEVWLRTTD